MAARDRALREYGDAGYSGSIAEKTGFVEFKLGDGEDPLTKANIIMGSDYRVMDKWGPAGRFNLNDGRFYFFGWTPESR